MSKVLYNICCLFVGAGFIGVGVVVPLCLLLESKVFQVLLAFAALVALWISCMLLGDILISALAVHV